MGFWNNDVEIDFFVKALNSFSSPEKLFYRVEGEYLAYIPKNKSSEGQTLQSRNALIGAYTEKWCKEFLNPIARRLNLYAVNGVKCTELGLINSSSADLAFCTTDNPQQTASNIKLIFEIKMSVASNYKFVDHNTILFIGDFMQHKGVPSFTRSDSMLKAIGKSINIRVSSISGTKIPIIILGNSPMSNNYLKKVDALNKAGVIQGFWSLNPNPTQREFIKNSQHGGFTTFQDVEQIYSVCNHLLNSDYNYFSGMLTKSKIANYIKQASLEPTELQIADKFLQLLNQ